MALGYFVDAEKYLGEAVASPDHPWVAKNLATLKAQLATAKTQIGELYVIGEPTGAEVLVNGKLVGRLPLSTPIRLDKGRAEVQVRALRLRGDDGHGRDGRRQARGSVVPAAARSGRGRAAAAGARASRPSRAMPKPASRRRRRSRCDPAATPPGRPGDTGAPAASITATPAPAIRAATVRTCGPSPGASGIGAGAAA